MVDRGREIEIDRKRLISNKKKKEDILGFKLFTFHRFFDVVELLGQVDCLIVCFAC
jgi:hypothetical protein